LSLLASSMPGSNCRTLLRRPQGTAWKIAVAICLMLFLQVASLSSLEAATWRCLSDDDCIANEEYQKAIEALEEEDWRESEKCAEKAIEHVSSDTSTLSMRGECLVIGGGSRPRKSWINCEKSAEYFPNEILKGIRLEHPPMPLVEIKFIDQEKGLTDGAFLKKNGRCIMEARIENSGETKMEQMELLVKSGKFQTVIDLGTVPAAGSATGKTDLPGQINSALKFSFKERYGFVPASFTISFR
jgi:hypothetical protein